MPITTFTITPSSTSQILRGSNSNAARWSQINRFISLIWKGLGSCLPRSPPLPGVYWWGLFAGTHSFMFFDLLVCEEEDGWGAYQVQGGCPGSFVFPTLSESLGRSKCLMALVIWLLWRVLWWMVMQCRFFRWCLNNTTGYAGCLGWVF